MKSALLATLGTASALPAIALVSTSPASSASFDLWMKEMAAKAAAAGTTLNQATDAITELQKVLAQPVPAPSTPAPSPSPTPTMNHTAHHTAHQTTAAPLSPIIVNGLASLAAITSGLDLNSVVQTGIPIANTGKPDVVGAFRFICEPSHIAYADPVVYPGDRSGKSHLHVFFGNTKTDADSTYESLRTTGDSTCINTGNRSAYWEPALIQTNAAGANEVVMPNHLNVYYKRRPASDPYFQANGVTPVNIPRGLRYVFGYPTSNPTFKCVDPRTSSNITDWSTDMRATLAKCPTGRQLDVSVTSPACWDGKNLDSADHRSHMANPRGGADHNWVVKCPATHPYEIPTFTLQSIFTILPTDRPTTWRFSSDMMQPGAAPGSTFHADWFGAWEDKLLDTWQDWCINKLLTCSSGNLGNGTTMRESPTYVRLKQMPEQRLPMPAA